jgi:multidrug transporter EmrE-like cation transporter
VTRAVLIFLAGVVMAASGQLLLKTGALRGRNRSLHASFFDPFLIVGYVLMLASTVTSTIALKTLPLHLTVALAPLGFAVMTILSVVLLHEKMRRHHVWGMLLILAGIVIFNLGLL